MIAGADIENLVNQAALQAARLGKDAIDMQDLEYSKDKILMGNNNNNQNIELMYCKLLTNQHVLWY